MESSGYIFPEHLHQNICASWTQPAEKAVTSPFPASISKQLVGILQNAGISDLYAHQAQCIEAIQNKKHVVISTGTASGKSLCYQIPILSSLLDDHQSTALLLFPTKALAADQQKSFNQIINEVNTLEKTKIISGIYDGDTRSNDRTSIRNKTNILLSNPDMIHISILPHHPSWADFLSHLKFVVIDEAHTYTGVFGSHFANLVRRLKRIAAHYGANPQFILSSATISNPAKFAHELIEEEVAVFDQDYSEKGIKHFAFYNPPIINQELGVRKSMTEESVQIVNHLLNNHLQTILFSRSRISVEKMYLSLVERFGSTKYQIAPYRSGYRKEERRQIENGLKNREIDLVVATVALELGIDMGMVDVILMNGYPGSITRFLQQAGRAGRRNRESMCILVSSSLPLDQYIINHSEFVRDKNPECIFINPDNPFILFSHIRSAAFELPFLEGENFGRLTHAQIKDFLDVLREYQSIYLDGGKYYWTSNKYPASEISLRSISGFSLQLYSMQNETKQYIGEIDPQSAKKIVYPGAIYIHQGDLFRVVTLDLENNVVLLNPAQDSIYFTEPLVEVDTTIESTELEKSLPDYKKGFGDIKVIERIKGFRKILWDSLAVISEEALNFEPDILDTKGMWVLFSSEIVQSLQKNKVTDISAMDYGKEWQEVRKKILLRDKNTCQLCGNQLIGRELHVHHKQPFRTFATPSQAHHPDNLITLCPVCHKIAEKNLYIRGTLSGLAYGISNIAPVFIKSSTHDIGYTTQPTQKTTESLPGIVFYDQFTGGMGLAKNIYDQLDIIFDALLEHLSKCPCSDGCPSCVGPGGENGIGAKDGVRHILESLH
jgi:DEAD/DEAH box helicase domain-containing protein